MLTSENLHAKLYRNLFENDDRPTYLRYLSLKTSKISLRSDLNQRRYVSTSPIERMTESVVNPLSKNFYMEPAHIVLVRCFLKRSYSLNRASSKNLQVAALVTPIMLSTKKTLKQSFDILSYIPDVNRTALSFKRYYLTHQYKFPISKITKLFAKLFLP